MGEGETSISTEKILSYEQQHICLVYLQREKTRLASVFIHQLQMEKYLLL